VTHDTAKPAMAGFQRVAILGAGTMGHALALVHALAGCAVRLQDIQTEMLDRAPQLIAQAFDTLVEGGIVPAETRAAVLARITLSSDLEETVRGADLVVEAVVEDPEIKRQLFLRLAELMPADATLASNSSYLDVFALAPASLAERLMIVHWYTPPYIIDLVDLVSGPATAPAAIEAMRGFLSAIGKQPVVFERFIAGFIANRLQAAMNLEILALLDSGLVSAEDIDRSIVHGLSARMAILGGLMKADFTGLDMTRRALANRTYTPPEPSGRSRVVDDLVAKGRTGVMSGAGFYDYGGADPAELFRERDRKLLAMKRALQDVGGSEIEKHRPL
jgi:3-hydroxybutyryl-CoA dehydrogenase